MMTSFSLLFPALLSNSLSTCAAIFLSACACRCFSMRRSRSVGNNSANSFCVRCGVITTSGYSALMTLFTCSVKVVRKASGVNTLTACSVFGVCGCSGVSATTGSGSAGGGKNPSSRLSERSLCLTSKLGWGAPASCSSERALSYSNGGKAPSVGYDSIISWISLSISALIFFQSLKSWYAFSIRSAVAIRLSGIVSSISKQR